MPLRARDVGGRLVRQLSDCKCDRERHAVSWDGFGEGGDYSVLHFSRGQSCGDVQRSLKVTHI